MVGRNGLYVVVVCGRGRGRCVVAIRVLSQQTRPSLQLEVFGIITAGASQNARNTFTIQNPGHFGG